MNRLFTILKVNFHEVVIVLGSLNCLRYAKGWEGIIVLPLAAVGLVIAIHCIAKNAQKS